MLEPVLGRTWSSAAGGLSKAVVGSLGAGAIALVVATVSEAPGPKLSTTAGRRGTVHSALERGPVCDGDGLPCFLTHGRRRASRRDG
jgi:hypothetical protein